MKWEKTFQSHFLRFQSDVFNQLSVKKVQEKQEVTSVTSWCSIFFHFHQTNWCCDRESTDLLQFSLVSVRSQSVCVLWIPDGSDRVTETVRRQRLLLLSSGEFYFSETRSLVKVIRWSGARYKRRAAGWIWARSPPVLHRRTSWTLPAWRRSAGLYGDHLWHRRSADRQEVRWALMTSLLFLWDKIPFLRPHLYSLGFRPLNIIGISFLQLNIYLILSCLHLPHTADVCYNISHPHKQNSASLSQYFLI